MRNPSIFYWYFRSNWQYNITKIKTTIRKAYISNRFRSSIQIRSLKLEPGNRQLVWHGVAIDPEIIIFDDNVVK